MKVFQFKLLAEMMDYRSLTALARKFNMTQSAVSKQLMSIEKQLGFDVIDRTHRKLAVSDAGKEAVQYAKAIVNDYECVCAEIQRLNNMQSKSIDIGTVPILEIYGITEIFFKYRDSHPNVSINITETATLDILESLNNGKVDVGLIRSTFQHDNCYDIHPVYIEEYVLVMNRKHPLAASDNADISRMTDDTFLLMGDPYYTVFYDEIFKHYTILPKIKYTNMRITTMMAYIKNDEASVSLLPRKLAQYHADKDIKIQKLNESPRLYLSFITRKNTIIPEEVSELIEYVEDMMTVK